jgi:hypothetical protein
MRQRSVSSIASSAWRRSWSNSRCGPARAQPKAWRSTCRSTVGMSPPISGSIPIRFRGSCRASAAPHTDRNRVVVRDFAALAARTPAAKSLLAMSANPS